uniref:Uncharacterized protein n=1 Tax=Theropithecus gelada TaxID=9565 RepID=A0A8D2JYU0_THEGE
MACRSLSLRSHRHTLSDRSGPGRNWVPTNRSAAQSLSEEVKAWQDETSVGLKAFLKPADSCSAKPTRPHVPPWAATSAHTTSLSSRLLSIPRTARSGLCRERSSTGEVGSASQKTRIVAVIRLVG